jgi:predicted HicB family RNase H-like nuclease
MVAGVKGRKYHPTVAELRIRKMDETLRRELKLMAIREGVTLNDLVLRILASALGHRKK